MIPVIPFQLMYSMNPFWFIEHSNLKAIQKIPSYVYKYWNSAKKFYFYLLDT